MKRIFILFSTVVLASIVVRALRNETALAGQRTLTARELQRAKDQRLQELRIEVEQLRGKVEDAKILAEEFPAGRTDPLAMAFAESALKNLSAGNAERLLADLGYDWNSMGDYLFVSKTSLPEIRMSGIRGAKLTKAVCAALAMTPDEQETINGEIQRLTSDYTSWLRTHVQQEEPSGKILAKFMLSADPQFAGVASNAFTDVIYSTLGDQRARLLQQYSWDWMESMGMFGNGQTPDKSTSMTITREGDTLMMELRQAMSSMSCGITPYQPFPGAFHPLFPGGWKDLAQHAGFELPKEFSEK
jgi:hypothetical protein